ncbi:hypothetical protein GCM10010439_29760 [Actinocorallia aurantiaca]|uniref:Uncharacterized protein n=2 Tax=Actinocorallia aurantiaca TaxID=46204 RepID=A0ABP6GR00_9ACTN
MCRGSGPGSLKGMIKLATPAALLYAISILCLSYRLHTVPGSDPGLDGVWLLLASLPTGLVPLMLPLPESRDVFLLAMTAAGLFQALLVWLAGRMFDSPLLQKPGPVIMPPSTRTSLPEQ